MASGNAWPFIFFWLDRPEVGSESEPEKLYGSPQAMWGLLKVFLPKACAQQSLCRRSLAQSFEATAIGHVTRGKLDKYEKECDIWCVTVTCDCDRDCVLTSWTWLDVCWVLDFLELALTKLWLGLNFLLLLQVRQRPLYTNPQATTMQDDAICLVGSWVSWMTKHENKRYKKGNNDESMSQPGSARWVRSN